MTEEDKVIDEMEEMFSNKWFHFAWNIVQTEGRDQILTATREVKRSLDVSLERLFQNFEK